MSKRSILLFVLAFITLIIITYQTFAACCVGTTGNVDGSVDGVADISDVFAIVDLLSANFPLSTCVDENDVNKDGTIDVSDLFAIIDYLSGATPLPPCPTVTDIDGNVYQTVTIGTQVWMAENLRVTHYRNGDPIFNVTDQATWTGLTAGAYCDYDNDTGNVALYGRLYNWAAVLDGRKIAPSGWHVPNYAEWLTLVSFLGPDAGGKMKESGTTHWLSPNVGATNESGFSGLPSGYRLNGGGTTAGYSHMGEIAYFWSSTEYDVDMTAAWFAGLLNFASWLSTGGAQNKASGFSIRCVKD